MIQSSTTSASVSTVATRTMLIASGKEMKRHLVVVSLNDVGDAEAEDEEPGQDVQQLRQAVVETLRAVEADVEGDEQRAARRDHVVERDQAVAQREMREARHSITGWRDGLETRSRGADSPSRMPLPVQLTSGTCRCPSLFAAFDFNTIPPAIPTPSTYIQPSWKSKTCELNTEVRTFCATTSKPIQLARAGAAKHQDVRQPHRVEHDDAERAPLDRDIERLVMRIGKHPDAPGPILL